MSKLFYLIGKSSSGKDSVYARLISDKELNLQPLIPYTTRPIRDNEKNGQEYFFVDTETYFELERQNKVIEMRCYHTIHGEWRYFTVDDENIDFSEKDYIAIGTLESYEKIRMYYGPEKVIPIYIEVDDGIRLERALIRERLPQNQKYEEMCRRFLADAKDYSEENIRKAGITEKISNNEDLESCMEKVRHLICSKLRNKVTRE